MKHTPTTEEERLSIAQRLHKARVWHARSMLSFAIMARDCAKDLLQDDGDTSRTPEWCAKRARGYRQIMRRHALQWRRALSRIGTSPQPPQAELAL